MYGLPQAGKIANDQLIKHLAKFGYSPAQHTPVLWKHKDRDISFCLVVDDFGIKYTNKNNLQHLIRVLQQLYTITIDRNINLFCGITLRWDYENQTVDLSRPGYIRAALEWFKHPIALSPEHAPHAYVQSQYKTGPQMAPLEQELPELGKQEKTRIQQVLRTLLFHARAVDPTMLMAPNAIAAKQEHPTSKTAAAIVQLLNYCAMHQEATFRYHASGMVLHIHSDASYLSAPRARTRAGGHFFLSDRPSNPTKPKESVAPPNSPIHLVCKLLCNVMTSTTKAEIGALYTNARKGEEFRTALQELNHPQLPTPIMTGNTTTNGSVNDTIKQRRLRAIDMQFYWLKDCCKQGHFQ
eukprot:894302-Ditylum_brightwellii.AAC.1